MGTWVSESGLYTKFGTSEGVKTKGGEFNHLGPERCIELAVTLADLTETETVLADNIVLPKESLITKVEVVTLVAGTLGTAIDIGTYKLDRTTVIDADGLLAAAPIANFNNVGETYTFTQDHTIPASATGTGADIGEIVAYPSLITGSRTDATAFGAGVILLRIYFRANALTV